MDVYVIGIVYQLFFIAVLFYSLLLSGAWVKLCCHLNERLNGLVRQICCECNRFQERSRRVLCIGLLRAQMTLLMGKLIGLAKGTIISSIFAHTFGTKLDFALAGVSSTLRSSSRNKASD